jgi:hypothetical protein
MATQTQKIWFAGFYEGEGTVCNDKSNGNRLRVSIAQNDRTPLDLGQNIWGGAVRQRKRKSPASDKICIGHEWVLSHCQAEIFLKDIKPFMIIPYKINQVATAYKKLGEPLEPNYKCSFCDAAFTYPSNRRRHERGHLEEGSKFKCEKCPLEYTSRDSLQRHVKDKHPDASDSNTESQDTSLRETPKTLSTSPKVILCFIDYDDSAKQ